MSVYLFLCRFVHFSTVKEAQTAIDMFHSSRYQGTRFLVTWATPRPQGSVPPPTDHNFLSHDSHMTDDVTFDHHQMLPSTLSTPPYGSKVYVGTSPTMTSPSAGFPGPTSQHYTETRMSDSFEESSTDSNSIIIEEDPDVDEVGRSSTFEVFVSEVCLRYMVCTRSCVRGNSCYFVVGGVPKLFLCADLSYYSRRSEKFIRFNISQLSSACHSCCGLFAVVFIVYCVFALLCLLLHCYEHP